MKFPIHVDDMLVRLEDNVHNDEHTFKLLPRAEFGPDDWIQEWHYYYNLVYPAVSAPASMDMVLFVFVCRPLKRRGGRPKLREAR